MKPEMTLGEARNYLHRRGAKVRFTGGGLVKDNPQLEAKSENGNWLYVASIAEGEVSSDHVVMWAIQNLSNCASDYDDTPYWLK